MTLSNINDQLRVTKTSDFKDYIAILSGSGRIPSTQSTLWTGFRYHTKKMVMLWVAIILIVVGLAIQLLLALFYRPKSKTKITQQLKISSQVSPTHRPFVTSSPIPSSPSSPNVSTLEVSGEPSATQSLSPSTPPVSQQIS